MGERGYSGHAASFTDLIAGDKRRCFACHGYSLNPFDVAWRKILFQGSILNFAWSQCHEDGDVTQGHYGGCAPFQAAKGLPGGMWAATVG